MADAAQLTVAVTGPTGDIGRALVRCLDRSAEIGRVIAMARRQFDPAATGLTKTEYRRGDVLDRLAVEELVAGADVVVHLAFLVVGGHEETARINLDGSRTVFEAALAAGAKRLIYASSVAAYGFHGDNPPLLTEAMPPRGSDRHYYAAQKAELEAALGEVTEGTAIATYLFRPCIVGGPDALALIKNIPYVQLGELVRRYESPLTATVLEAARRFPALKPVLPDPGVPFQLVHHDDVASAFRAAVLGRGTPGPYNLAGPGEVTIGELAAALGWYSFPVSETALESLAELIARLPLVPAQAQWIKTIRQPMLMDTSKARRELDWQPQYDAQQTLRAMVDAALEQGLLDLS